LATLQVARNAMHAGVRETSRNDGPEIRQYAEQFGVATPLNWCAVSLCSWMLHACKLIGINPPIEGSPAARGVMGQFMLAGLWVPKRLLTPELLVPGNVPIWWRVSPEDWRGHIGIIDCSAEWLMHTIEGNSGRRGDRVAGMERWANHLGVKLLGIGQLSKKLIEYEPSDEELETARHLITLGKEVMLGEPDDPLAGFDDKYGEG
jgi:hypothetical protein